MSNFDIIDLSASEKNLKGEELKSIQEIEYFQKYFDELAKHIFGHVAIVIGDSSSTQIKYYLEEIEFYYNNSIIEEEEITYTSKNEIKKGKRIFFLALTNVKGMQSSCSGIIVVWISVFSLTKIVMEGFLSEASLKSIKIKMGIRSEN